MHVHILKDFPFSRDGINALKAFADTIEDIPDRLVEGLRREGFIGKAGGSPPAASVDKVQKTHPPLQWPLSAAAIPQAGFDGLAEDLKAQLVLIAATDGTEAADKALQDLLKPVADGSIPDDWEGQPWFTIQRLFEKHFGTKPKNKDEAKALFAKAKPPAPAAGVVEAIKERVAAAKGAKKA